MYNQQFLWDIMRYQFLGCPIYMNMDNQKECWLLVIAYVDVLGVCDLEH